MKVTLREKKLKHGKRGLYLDFYPPIVNPDTNRQTRREHLKLYVFEDPRTKTEKEHNKKTFELGEIIRAKRQLEIQSESYGFLSGQHKTESFIEFVRKLTELKKQRATGTYRTWYAMLVHLETFAPGCRFGDVTEGFCGDFKSYLINDAGITANSASIYLTKFKSTVSLASDNGCLAGNPGKRLKTIQIKSSKRDFLSIAEVKQLAAVPFKYEDLRRAGLFSILTGLRFSDCEKLIWGEIRHNAHGYFISARLQKTDSFEVFPISDEAFEMLSERGGPDEKVFKYLNYNQCRHLSEWFTAAGITRKLGFHSFRHTYATLQLSAGTDLAVVSEMLGHKDIKTTRIYAKIVSERKREATNKITLK